MERERGKYDRPIWDIVRYTDQDLVERWARESCATTCYVTDDASWLKYETGLWLEEPVGPIFEIGEYLKSQVPPESALDPKSWTRLHHRLNSQKLVAAIKALAIGRPELHHRADDFDPNDMLLGLPYGQCLDLRTGEPRAATADDLITKCLGSAPAERESERWLQFLEETHPGDPETQNFLKRFFGYCLTASTREDVLLFFLGVGGSSKGTTISPISVLMGPYYAPSSVSTFMEDTPGDRRANYLAELRGKRLVVLEEGLKSKSLDAQTLKDLSGGGMMEARRLGHQPFRFNKTFKILILANDPPVLELDEALRQRIRIISFNQQFRGTANCNPDLRDFFKTPEQQAGILRWAINGCLEWQRSGLGYPKAVETAVDDYFDNSDLLQSFSEECVQFGATYSVPTRELFQLWQAYRRDHGYRPTASNVFVPDVLKRWKDKVTWDKTARPRLFRGIRLSGKSAQQEF